MFRALNEAKSGGDAFFGLWPRMAEAVRLGRAANRASLLAGKDHTNRENRLIENMAVARVNEATDAAIAEELLPALLGRAWVRCSTFLPYLLERTTRTGYPPRPWNSLYSHALFDHPKVFGLAGKRGRPSLDTRVLVGQPYDVTGPDGELQAPFVEAAKALARDFGLSVWVSPELSTWLSGRTALVIAARGLPADAARFEFVQAAPNGEPGSPPTAISARVVEIQSSVAIQPHPATAEPQHQLAAPATPACIVCSRCRRAAWWTPAQPATGMRAWSCETCFAPRGPIAWTRVRV